MIELVASRRFGKRLGKLSKKRQDAVAKTLHQFLRNPQHPGLRLEKLMLSEGDYWSLRVSLAERIILLKVQEEVWELVDVGGHELYQKLRH